MCSPAAQNARNVSVHHFALEGRRPALASCRVSTVHDGAVQLVDISARSRCCHVDAWIVKEWLSRKLSLCEVELASRDKVVCRLSRTRYGESICCEVGRQRLESVDDDVLVRRPSIRCIPEERRQQRLDHEKLSRTIVMPSSPRRWLGKYHCTCSWPYSQWRSNRTRLPEKQGFRRE